MKTPILQVTLSIRFFNIKIKTGGGDYSTAFFFFQNLFFFFLFLNYYYYFSLSSSVSSFIFFSWISRPVVLGAGLDEAGG